MTEVLNGKDLFEQIISKKKFEEGEAKELFFKIIDAMIYMHSMFICHRDIKLENILFDKNNPKIIDFGFATFYKKGKKLKEAFGSPSYACPEMQKGSEYDPEKADVWSCGVLLYVMVNGYLPFSEEDDEKNKELIIKGDFYMPKELSAPLKDLLKHMLEPNEDNRFDFGKIGNHEWFKGCPVMTGGLNIFDLIYPVDDRVIKAVNYFGIDKDKVSDELKKNKFTNATGVYKQIVKRVVQSGMMSYSDLQSMEYKSYKRLKEHRVKKEEGEKESSSSQIRIHKNAQERKNSKWKLLYEGQKRINKHLKIAIAMLVILILSLFVIEYKSQYSIFTYFTDYKSKMEQELIDQYENWEEQLQQREDALQQREDALNGGTENGTENSSR